MTIAEGGVPCGFNDFRQPYGISAISTAIIALMIIPHVRLIKAIQAQNVVQQQQRAEEVEMEQHALDIDIATIAAAENDTDDDVGNDADADTDGDTFAVTVVVVVTGVKQSNTETTKETNGELELAL